MTRPGGGRPAHGRAGTTSGSGDFGRSRSATTLECGEDISRRASVPRGGNSSKLTAGPGCIADERRLCYQLTERMACGGQELRSKGCVLPGASHSSRSSFERRLAGVHHHRVKLERTPLPQNLERPVPRPQRRSVYHPFSSCSKRSYSWTGSTRVGASTSKKCE